MNPTIIIGKRIALIGLVLLLAGCNALAQNAPAAGNPTQDLDAVRTQAAGTVIADITLAAAMNPTATQPPADTAIPLPPPATSTPIQLPSLAAPTVLPSATVRPPVVVYPTITRTPYVDVVDYISQTPGDGVSFSPNTALDIVWTVRNSGLRPWNNSFYLRYLKGVKGSKGNTYMLGPLAVGDTTNLRVDFVAPPDPGSYSTYWQLVNDDAVVLKTLSLVFTVQ